MENRSDSEPIASSSAPHPSISCFLRLPAELRDQIYASLLTFPHISPSILVVSRLTYRECLPHLYVRNTFKAHPALLTSLPHLLRPCHPLTAPALIALIRRFRISVRLDVDPVWSKEAVAKAFSGLEMLEIEVWQASFGSCGVGVLEAFGAVRGVAIAKVSGCVSGGFARWLEALMMGDEAVHEWEGERWNGWERG